MTGRIRVALVFGGRSAEHEVSVVSAGSVAEALDPERYELVAVGIDKDGRWHLLAGPPALEAGSTEALPSVHADAGSEVTLAREPGARELVSPTGEREPIDVVFPILHGPFGEDGTIQGLLDLAGVPYVGSGVLASAVGMDKAVQKVLFRAAGLRVADHLVVQEREWLDDPEAVEAAAGGLGFPVFVKPTALGSSVGITKVREAGELGPAMKEAFSYGRKALIERSVEAAREIELSVLGNDDPVASVAGEIVPEGHEFYDYDAKYVDEDGARLVIPAALPPETLEELQRQAVAAFRVIDGAGMARVDFFLAPSGEIYLNEINTIPGFTKISMYPKLWEASGVPYRELIARLIDLAIERHAQEERRGRSR